MTKIAATYSAANNRSNLALNQADQALDEQGSALQIDDAGFVLEQRAGFKTADGSKYYPFSLVPVEASVPRQVGYPAKVEALLQTKASAGTPASYACTGGSQVDVFVKDSASAPWRAALEPEVTTSLVPKFASGSGGFAPSVGTAAQAQAAKLPAELTTALGTYAKTGRLSEGLTASDFGTPTQCWGIDNLRTDVTSEASDQVKAAVAVSVYSPGDLSLVPLASGDGVLALFSLKIVETYKPAQAGDAITWSHSSTNPFGDSVAAGNYSSVTVPEICELAAIDPSGAAAVPRIVGSNCSPLIGSGKKASGGQTTPAGPPNSAVLESQTARG